MPLDMEEGLGPAHIVLDGDLAPPKGAQHSAPNFLSPCLLWPNGWKIKMPLGTEVGLSPGHIVLDGYRAPLPKGTQQPPPQFSAYEEE